MDAEKITKLNEHEQLSFNFVIPEPTTPPWLRRNRTVKMPKFKATIHWGEDLETHRGDSPQTYAFKTLAEIKAFLFGVSEAVGYMDFAVIEEGERCEVCGCDEAGLIVTMEDIAEAPSQK